MRIPPFLFCGLLLACSPSAAWADYVVDQNLGGLPLGDTTLVGTTAGGNNNSIFPKFIFNDGPLLNFGTEFVYEFELLQPSILSITAFDVTNNPDFFLLNGLATSLDFQSGKISADNAQQVALLDNPPEAHIFRALMPGIYYLAVENFDGVNGMVVPRDADYDIDLTVEEAIAIDFPIDLGPIARTGTPIALDTVGSDFDTELAIFDFVSGAVLFENDDAPAGGLTSVLDFPNGLPAGTYYAVVAGNDTTFGPNFALSAGGATGNWTFNFPLGPTVPRGEETGTTESAFVGTEAQWFIFDIVDPPPAPIDLGILASPDERFVVDSEGSDFDTQLALYDAEGFWIDFDDDIEFIGPGDPGNNLASRLDFVFGLPEGEYFLSLAGWPNIYADGFFIRVDTELNAFSEGGDYVLNHPSGPSNGSIALSTRQWFTFRVGDLTIDITDVAFDRSRNEFTVTWESNVPGPFNIFAGTGDDLAALQAAPNNILPTQVAAGATSPATFPVPAGLRGDRVFFQIAN